MSNPHLYQANLAVMVIQIILLFFLNESESINISSTLYADLPKCCEVGSVFVEQDDNLICKPSDNQRVVVQNDYMLDINNITDYKCVEAINRDLYLFERTVNKTSIVRNISDRLFPKCCPESYLYDTSSHSCVESLQNATFNSTFLKVGLLDCQVIYDYQFEHIADIQINENDVYISKWNEKIMNDKYCIDETVHSDYVARVCRNFDICESVLCLHKCCPDGQSFINGSNCKDTYVHGMDLNKFSNIIPESDEYAIIHGYRTKVYIPRGSKYHLDDRGYFYTFQEKTGHEVFSPDDESYCIEHATKGGTVFGHTLFRIVPEIEYVEKKFLYNRWAMVISNIFLVITVAYYIYSDETRKVFGKTLVSFCTSLFILFATLIYCTFNSNLNTKNTLTACKTIGFLLIYLSFSCFVWLQVMCYDIYWTFGSSKRYTSFSNKKMKDLKRFICYSLYGWGVPLVITLIILIFHFVDFLPTFIKIEMGETKCLIERGDDNYAEILFYIIPLTLIQTVNVVFFIKTVRYCLQVKGNIQKMNQSVDTQKKDKFRARKERFGLVIKLAFIMGFLYLFEVVSSFYDFRKNTVTEHIEIIWDFINCLQGLFIFIIFICKAKLFKNCSRKVAMEKIRKISLTTTTTKITALSSEKKSNRETNRKQSKEEVRKQFS